MLTFNSRVFVQVVAILVLATSFFLLEEKHIFTASSISTTTSSFTTTSSTPSSGGIGSLVKEDIDTSVDSSTRASNKGISQVQPTTNTTSTNAQDQQQQAPPAAAAAQEEGGVLPTINITVLKEELAAAKDELVLLKAEREALSFLNNTVAATNETTTKESSKNHQDETKISIALKPPFKILSIGQPRTGSTFQLQLLSAILSLKSPSSITIQKRYISSGKGFHSLVASLHQESFLYKVHSFINDNATAYVHKLVQDGDVFLFTTFNDAKPSKHPKLYKSKFAVLSQTTSQLNSCSLCEVDRYKDIFNLTNVEVSHLRDYMSKYQIIRRCCGFQMSKYEMARLHGCDVQEYVGDASYPDCEIYNKTLVELQFAHHSSGKGYNSFSSYNWESVGDCARIDNDIVENGKWFNESPFRGCQAHGFKEAYPPI